MDHPRLTGVHPRHAVVGGRIRIDGTHFPTDGDRLPVVRIGGAAARVVYASSTRLDVIVPPDLEGSPAGSDPGESGPREIAVEGVEGVDAPYGGALLQVAAPFAQGLHQVDNPVFDDGGNLYVTYSGTRGQEVPVSIFRVRPDGVREMFSSGVVNPTSAAIGPDGNLYVSSRFEGVVYRLEPDGTPHPFANNLGIACGLAFAPDGTLFVGDRSGTVFAVDRTGRPRVFASLPSSVAAFHLALGPDGALYVAGPTLSSYDAVYRIAPSGVVSVRSEAFGRPQGLAFDRTGALFVVEALAGASGLYRLPAATGGNDSRPELILAAPELVGVAFDPTGQGVVVCSNDSAFRVTLAA